MSSSMKLDRIRSASTVRRQESSRVDSRSTDLRVASFRIHCLYWDGHSNEKTLSGRRKGRRLIRSCTALVRNLCCFGTEIDWIWPQSRHGWSYQPINTTLTMLPHHVRVDRCMRGMRESTRCGNRSESNPTQLK